ncbi:MAG: metallophosphoesterase [Micropruina sp.]|uniref:metallophosphoesterase n=1 Tax=Micropruina sp. TaxID=2737536 RepID=UPI0039E67466
MISAPSHPRRPGPQHRTLPRLLAAVLLASALLVGAVPNPADAATTKSLALTANASAWAKVGPSRTTQIARITVTAPTGAVEFGLQFRAKAKSSGYRTKLTIAADGSLSGAFSRVSSYNQTSLSGGGPLGVTVRPGERIHLEATVAGTNPARLYLRAWKDGSSKPAGWQLVAKDSSSKRFTGSGSLYLWARTPSGSPKVALRYTVDSVAAFSLVKANQIKVVAPPSDQPGADPGEVFRIAVIGDTQDETNSATDRRFGNRTAWLAANKDALNLRYVLHTGDMVNWGWLVPSQYTHAKAAMSNLTKARLPFSAAIGNHDTRAVGWDGVKGSRGYGGSAYVGNPECVERLGAKACNTNLLVRDTAEFNDAFPLKSMIADVGGTFEPGKVDNTWTSFAVGKTKWLVLSLEFAPRRTAVEWGRQVVANHPDHNVIIVTHYYLNGDGNISSSNAGYGETSGKYIYDQIVSKYPNVKIVTSGHVGKYTSRTDTIDGNTVVSYLGDKLGGSDNPLRILTIDTATGRVDNTVYSVVTDSAATEYSSGRNTISIIR